MRAGLEAVRVATDMKVPHFVYVSVAQPAPLMKSYLEARAVCEAAIRECNLSATILRPWYVLGPGHRWPYCLAPIYKLAELLPLTRDGARSLGLVTLRQMLATLLYCIDHPARGVSVLGVPEIRAAGGRRMENEPLFASA